MLSFHYPPVDLPSLRWGCCLTSVGALAYEPGMPYPAPGHPREFDFRWTKGRVIPDFALIFITGGSGEWQTRGEECRKVREGDALYLVPGGWHRYRPSSATGWHEKWICLRGVAIHGFVEAGVLPRVCTLLPGGIRRHAEVCMDRLRAEATASPLSNAPSWGARGLAIILECFEEVRPKALTADASLIESALQFIKKNAHRPIRVPDVVLACGTERRTLERRFSAFGMGSIAQTIVEERVKRAEMLLLETDLQIKEIAYACGFGNVQRMIYDFRRHRGLPPGRIRSSAETR